MGLLQKLTLYQENTINLTLDYYLKNKLYQKQEDKFGTCHDADTLNKISMPWWIEMDSDYESFAEAVKNQDLDKCRDLINKGLNIHGKLRNETMTAIEYAEAK